MGSTVGDSTAEGVDKDEQGLAAVALSPGGRWVAALLSDGTLQIVPVRLLIVSTLPYFLCCGFVVFLQS